MTMKKYPYQLHLDYTQLKEERYSEHRLASFVLSGQNDEHADRLYLISFPVSHSP